MHKIRPELTDDAVVAEVKARFARTKTADLVEVYHSAEMLRTDEAMVIAGVKSTETIRRWCVETTDIGGPIGIHFAKGVWFVSLARLLGYIERHEGKPERLAAESRAKKLRKTRSAPQESLLSVAAPTG